MRDLGQTGGEVPRSVRFRVSYCPDSRSLITRGRLPFHESHRPSFHLTFRVHFHGNGRVTIRSGEEWVGTWYVSFLREWSHLVDRLVS